MTLYEKYRPKSLNEIVAQESAVNKIRLLLKRQWGGRAWWLAGLSGTGKTTLGRIIAYEGADEFFVEEYDSGDALKTEDLDRIEKYMHLSAYHASGKKGRAFIINEAHGLSRTIIRRLLGILERIPSHVVFIFTTTKLGEAKLFDDQIDAHPLLSRCTKIELDSQSLVEPFARHCRKIATKEKLNGRPLSDYIKLAQRCKSNMREMFQLIEGGEMLT